MLTRKHATSEPRGACGSARLEPRRSRRRKGPTAYRTRAAANARADVTARRRHHSPRQQQLVSARRPSRAHGRAASARAGGGVVPRACGGGRSARYHRRAAHANLRLRRFSRHRLLSRQAIILHQRHAGARARGGPPFSCAALTDRRLQQVSVAQYFAVDYHNVYKYVTDTRGVTPRIYILAQARPATTRRRLARRRLRPCCAFRRRIAAPAPRGRAKTCKPRLGPRACCSGAAMVPLRRATATVLTLPRLSSAAPRRPALPLCRRRTQTTTPAALSSSRRVIYRFAPAYAAVAQP